jgi:hypothetical protein
VQRLSNFAMNDFAGCLLGVSFGKNVVNVVKLHFRAMNRAGNLDF